MNILNNTVAKVGIGFAAGAILVGGISEAAPTITPGTKACVSATTNAIYATKNGACSTNQKLTVPWGKPTVSPWALMTRGDK